MRLGNVQRTDQIDECRVDLALPRGQRKGTTMGSLSADVTRPALAWLGLGGRRGTNCARICGIELSVELISSSSEMTRKTKLQGLDFWNSKMKRTCNVTDYSMDPLPVRLGPTQN